MPSAKMFPNTASVYPMVVTTSAYDDDAGLEGSSTYSGTPSASGLACAAHCKSNDREESGQDRVTSFSMWHVNFPANPGVAINDKLVVTVNGTSHTIFVDGIRDQAGRGVVWKVTGVERT